jgi:DNA polymerase elongation subunit (family B)
MSYDYDRLAIAVVEWAVSHGHSDRIVSLDLETKVLGQDEFLTAETVLSIAFARHTDSKVESKIFTLKDETPTAEDQLFFSANQFVAATRPLVIIGYNITGYDIPLLQMKLRNLPTPYWALKDMVERAFLLDLRHPLKFELADFDGSKIKIWKLEDVLNHERFSHLPLMKAKDILNGSKDEKGIKIYEMWKKRRADFERYAVGDVVDVLALFEELYLNKHVPKVVA